MPPAPRFDSATGAAEAIELYWMALLRDVPFATFLNNERVGQATAEIQSHPGFVGPKGGISELFRSNFIGVLSGPFISQFLFKPSPLGAIPVFPRFRSAQPGEDFLTNFDEWLRVQNGIRPNASKRLTDSSRYIITPRDLTHYVNSDFAYQSFLFASQILLRSGVPFDNGNPMAGLRVSDASPVFGGAAIQSLLGDVTLRAIKAMWFQKWLVHRRARPEEYGGRVDRIIRNGATYPIERSIVNSVALSLVASNTGTGLLPIAYPEGSPFHPSYGSSHSVIAGACATLLKAWFNEATLMPEQVEPNEAGTDVIPRSEQSLSVEGELNKLACNLGIGRCMAGLHWRSDSDASLKLGEEVAISFLREYVLTSYYPFNLSFRTFDGEVVTINKR
jgi:hypothetical protein